MGRVVASGALVAAMYFSLMTLVSLVGLHDQAALAIAYDVAVVVHFALNRHSSFRKVAGTLFTSRARSPLLDYGRGSYGFTALALAFLPSSLVIPRLAVYFAATAAMGADQLCVSARLGLPPLERADESA
jgi:putative flippase GtrA